MKLTGSIDVEPGTDPSHWAKWVDGDLALEAAVNAEAARDAAQASAAGAAADAQATAGNRIATAEDAQATAADRAQAGLDAVATAADRVATGLDAVATGADRVATGEDVVAAAASRSAAETARVAAEATVDEVDALGDAKIAVAQAAASDAEAAAALTAADAIATAADRVQTGLDRIATAADRTQASASAGAAASDKLAVEGLLASFRGIHLGSFANDSAATTAAASFGVTLVDGVQYSNTTTNQIRIWFDGAWADYDASSEQQLQAAQLSAGQAAASASSAQGSATAASDSATTAAAERVLAQTARTGAETAQTGAQTARTGAETAQAAAQTARTGAETARDAAQAAQAAAAASEAGVDASELLAQQWAQNPVDEPVIAADPEDPATSDQYSALHWANKSEVSQGIAGSYATSAVDAANSARIAANNAVAVVTGGTASLTAAAGRMPIADATGKIDPAWIDPISGVSGAALHRSPNAISSMFIYSTDKDSDGGAWTEKCQHTSWYNEPLMGKWLGAHDNETNARYAGATLGNELVTNGSFAADTNWTKDAGWTISGGVAVSASANGALYQSFAVTAGKVYRVEFTVLTRTAGLIAGRVGNVSGNGVSTVGTHVQYIVAGATAISGLTAAGSFSGTVDNVSIREVTAINMTPGDYYQLTTDGKFYRLWKNLFSYSTPQNVSIWTAATADYGSTTAVTFGAAGAVFDGAASKLARQIGALPGYPVTLSFTVKSVSNQIVGFSYRNPAVGVSAINYNPSTKAASIISGVNFSTPTVQIISADTARIIIPFAIFTGSNVSFAITGGGAGDTFSDFQWEMGSAFTSFEAKWVDTFVTETFRGNKADFPKLAAIVGEASSLTIYDLTEAGRPMWMRFITGGGGFGSGGIRLLYSNSLSVRALNGVFAVAGNGSWASSLLTINFARDLASWYGPGGSFNRGEWDVGLSRRNETPMWTLWLDNSNNLRTYMVRAVDLCAFLDAPVDPVTGLRAVTVAAATDSGLSLIGPSGVVRNSSSSISFTNIVLTPSLLSAGRADGTWYYAYNPATLASSFALSTRTNLQAPGFGIGDTNQLIGTGRSRLIRRSTASAIAQIARINESDPSRALVTNVANTHNTGWLVGDIRRAYLSDTSVGPVAGSELVTNATRADRVDLTGWTNITPTIGDATVVGGAIRVTATQVGVPILQQSITVTPGVPLVLEANVGPGFTASGLNSPQLVVTNNGASGVFGGYFYQQAGGKFYVLGIPTASTLIITLRCQSNAGNAAIGDYCDFYDIKIRAAVADRSYKGSPQGVYGTITRSQLATGTSLVGYSGWSASNYLRENWSADLDFGTGEWSCSAWVNVPTTLPATSFPVIGSNVYTGQTPTFSNANGSAATWDAATSTATVTANGSGYPFLQFEFGLSTSRAYEVEIQLTSASAITWTNVSVWLGLTNGPNLNSSGYAKFLLMPTGNATVFIRVGNIGTPPYSITIQTLSIREVGVARVADRAFSSGPQLRLGVNAGGQLTAAAFDGATTRTVTTSNAYNTATWLKAEACYTVDGSLAIRVNGREVAVTRGNPLLSLNSRYNQLTYTEALDNVAWTKTSVTVTANSITAPDTATTADLVVPTTTSTFHAVYVASALSAGVAYTASIYAKAGGYDKVVITDWNEATRIATFDLTNVTATLSGTGATVTLSNAVITSEGNGWYRCSVQITKSTAGQIAYFTNSASAFAGDGTSGVYLWGAQLQIGSALLPYQRVNAATDFSPQAPLTIGNSFATDAPFPGSIALLKLGATVPTYDQSLFMYEQEKQMFRAGAQTVLPDANSIIDMAYDDATDRWVAISSSNESYWTGLVRNSVTAVPAGSYSKVAATSGVELIARATTLPGVDVTLPPLGLREELARRAEAAAKASRELTAYDFVGGFTATTVSGNTAITSVASLSYPTSYIGARVSGSGIPANTTIVGVSGTTIYLSAAATASASNVSISFLDFALPVGMTAKTVISAGVVQQEGATKAFVRLWDGFYETIRFAVAPGVTAWVQIQATRDAAQ